MSVGADEGERPRDLDSLVRGWLTLAELAEAVAVPVSTLRQWIREGRLVTVQRGARRVASVPSDLVHEGALVRGLGSAFTVLADAGLSSEEALVWLLEPDAVLEARPVDLMAEGRDVAVRRRAMLLAL